MLLFLHLMTSAHYLINIFFVRASFRSSINANKIEIYVKGKNACVFIKLSRKIESFFSRPYHIYLNIVGFKADTCLNIHTYAYIITYMVTYIEVYTHRHSSQYLHVHTLIHTFFNKTHIYLFTKYRLHRYIFAFKHYT